MLTAPEQRALDAVSLDECVQLTRDLVQIDSSHDEGQIAEMLQNLFRHEGVACTTTSVPAAGDNVVATVGEETGPHLLYNAHMDTVPVGDRSAWSHPPLGGVFDRGRLFGRGTSDCKGGLAAMVFAPVALRRAGIRLPGTLTMAAVTGETKGNIGTTHLVENGLRADFAVLGEYSEATKIAVAYRGVVWGRITVHGRTTHPGRVADGADAINGFLDHVAPALRALDLTHEPHGLVPDAALTITCLEAGHAVNAVADRCVATVDVRIVPGQRAGKVWRAVENTITQVAEQSGVSVSAELIHALDPFETPADHPYVRTLAGAIAENGPNEVSVMGKAGMCDGNILTNRLGIPAVAYGPGNPSGAGVDEYCDVAALELSLRTYILFALRWIVKEADHVK